MNKSEVLNLKLEHDDFPKYFTIRDYLCELLTTLWEEKEGFNGKRPFGDSGWEYDLYKPLIKAGVLDGRIDEDDYIEYINEEQADNVIRLLISYCFFGKE